MEQKIKQQKSLRCKASIAHLLISPKAIECTAFVQLEEADEAKT
jgi:hypothetical protein